MSKFYLIALFVTLIGVASGFRKCHEIKDKLSNYTDYQELTLAVKDIENLLVVHRTMEAHDLIRSLRGVYFVDEKDPEALQRITEEVREFASTWLQKCERISEEWKTDIQDRFLRAIKKNELLDMERRMYQFLDVHGGSERKDQKHALFVSLIKRDPMPKEILERYFDSFNGL
ncbi:uncharacterized protein LOC141856215 [Brevipalpus obovatus]|uniref:uncharacterized protein LOC141856215 n=1 Tax=Brevipalpus obovatus TaxID=246614 RepID=UPI003D9F771A